MHGEQKFKKRKMINKRIKNISSFLPLLINRYIATYNFKISA